MLCKCCACCCEKKVDQAQPEKPVDPEEAVDPEKAEDPNKPEDATCCARCCEGTKRCLGCCGLMDKCRKCLGDCCASVWACTKYIVGCDGRLCTCCTAVGNTIYDVLTWVLKNLKSGIGTVSEAAVRFILPAAINLDALDKKYPNEPRGITTKLMKLDNAYVDDFHVTVPEDTKPKPSFCDSVKTTFCCGSKDQDDNEEKELFKAPKIALVCLTCKAQVSIMILQFGFTVAVRYALDSLKGEGETQAFVDAYATTFLERSIMTFMGTLAGRAVHAQNQFQTQVSTHQQLIHFIQARLYQLWYIL